MSASTQLDELPDDELLLDELDELEEDDPLLELELLELDDELDELDELLEELDDDELQTKSQFVLFPLSVQLHAVISVCVPLASQ